MGELCDCFVLGLLVLLFFLSFKKTLSCLLFHFKGDRHLSGENAQLLKQEPFQNFLSLHYCSEDT